MGIMTSTTVNQGANVIRHNFIGWDGGNVQWGATGNIMDGRELKLVAKPHACGCQLRLESLELMANFFTRHSSSSPLALFSDICT